MQNFIFLVKSCKYYFILDKLFKDANEAIGPNSLQPLTCTKMTNFLSEGWWQKLSLPILSPSMFLLKNVVRFYWWLNVDNNLGGQTLTNDRPAKD